MASNTGAWMSDGRNDEDTAFAVDNGRPDGTPAVRHRQRREGIRVAVSAAAVALVAVGVSAAVAVAVAEEPAPQRPDVAAPAAPTESHEGAAEELRGHLNMVRGAMAWWEEDRSVPDPSVPMACPEAASELSELFFGQLLASPTNLSGSTLSGCGWVSDDTATDTAEWLLELSLRAEADVSTDTVRHRLDAIAERETCTWTSLFSGEPLSALTVCDDEDQRTWTVTIVDDDGTGAWTLTTAVGQDRPQAFNTGYHSSAALWGVVTDLPATGEAPDKRVGHQDRPRTTTTSREFVEVVEALGARPEPLGLEATGDWACSGVTAALTSAFGVDLVEGQVRGSDPPEPLCWWSAGAMPVSDAEAARTVGLGIQFLPDLDDTVHRELADPGLQQLPGPEGLVYPDTCLRSEPFPARVRTTVVACSAGGNTQWRVISGDRDDSGLWGMSVYVPAGADVDQSAAVLTLVEQADRLW